jgi:uncharacterized protein (TIGR03435 family)
MKRFADFWAMVGRQIVDKTDLPGLYDITLKFDLIASPPREGDGGGRGGGRGGRGGGGGAEWSPPLPKAFEDQLGLHLEPATVPVEYLVVDHIEKPSEN